MEHHRLERSDQSHDLCNASIYDSLWIFEGEI